MRCVYAVSLLTFLAPWRLCAGDGHEAAGPRGKLVFVGGSVTHGFGVEPGEGFVARLAAMGPGVVTVEQGRPGWSTLAYLRFREEAVAALPADADWVCIQLGANDLHESGHTDAVVRRTAENLEKLADLFRQKAPRARVVLLSPSAVFPKTLSPYLRDAGYGEQTPAYVLKLADAYRELARRRGWGFIDLTGAISEGNTLDGLHPTPAGHAQLAEAVWKGLSAAPEVRK